MTFTPTESGTYYVSARGSFYQGAYELEVADTTDISVPEPDDYDASTGTAGVLEFDSQDVALAYGDIDIAGDVDWFAMELEANQSVIIRATGYNPETRSNYGGIEREFPGFGTYIWDGRGNPYADWRSRGDSVVDPDNTFDHGFFTPLESDTYYIPVLGASADAFWFGNTTLNRYWDEALAYNLTVTEAEDQPSADDYSADTSTTGEIEVDGEAVGGEIGVAGDVDWLAVDLVAGKTYVFIQKGSRNSEDNTLPRPSIVGVYDTDGDPIADTGSSYRSDGFDGPRVAYMATETGTHYVAVGADGWTTANRVGTYTIEAQEIDSDSVPADSTTTQTMDVRTVWFEVDLDASKHYIVTVGEADGGSDVLPFKVAVYDADGIEIDTWVRSTSADAVSLTAQISSRNHDGGTHYVAVTTAADNDSAAYEAEAHEVISAHTSSPTIVGTQEITQLDETPRWAGDLLRQWATGVIETVDDVDWIAVELEDGQTYEFRTEFAYPFGSYPGGEFGSFDLEGLYDVNGQRVAEGESSSLSYEAAADGTYYLAVTGGDHSGLGHYRVSVEEQPDAI